MQHETSEISFQEVKFYNEFTHKWETSKDVAKRAGCSDRTARAYAIKFVRLGLIDRAEVFPQHRYRLSDKASKRNVSYVQRLEQAKEVFGLPSK